LPAFYALIIYFSGLIIGNELKPGIMTQFLIVGITFFLLYDSIRTRPSLVKFTIFTAIFLAGLIRATYPPIIVFPDEWFERFVMAIEPFKLRLIDGIGTGLDFRHKELIGGIILGRGSGEMNLQYWPHFIKSGMSHLLVASGAQVSLCVFPLIALAENLNIPHYSRKLLYAAAAFLLFLLLLIVGVEPSILRAITAGYLYLLARMINRRARALNIIYATALLWLWVDPTLISNRGFQLSYAASWGLIYLYPRLRSIFPLKKISKDQSFLKTILRKMFIFAREIFLLSFAAQMAVMPVLAFNFHKLNPSGLLANLIAIPLSEVIIYLGLATSLVAQISEIPAIWMGTVNGFFLNILDGIARIFSRMPVISYPLDNAVALLVPYILIALYIEARFRPHGVINVLHYAQNILYPFDYFLRIGKVKAKKV